MIISISRNDGISPKTGVWAYAHTPVFGYSFEFREALIMFGEIWLFGNAGIKPFGHGCFDTLSTSYTDGHTDRTQCRRKNTDFLKLFPCKSVKSVLVSITLNVNMVT